MTGVSRKGLRGNGKGGQGGGGRDVSQHETSKGTFSIMGLVVSPGGDSNRLPAADPVMIRMLPRLA